MKLILQNEASECGLACLAMIASHHLRHTSMSELRRRFAVGTRGASLSTLMRYARAMHFAARPLRLELDEIPHLNTPCILHWDLSHYVVLKSVRKTWFGGVTAVIFDPAIGEVERPIDELSDHFTGIALELTPSDGFETLPAGKQLKVGDLIGKVVGLRRAVVKMSVMALLLEAFAVIFPLFTQLVVDEVVITGDLDLLTVLVIGFATLLVMQAVISTGRGLLIARWNVDIGFQWATRVMNHMLHLPASFFEKRHLGDISSRFGSIQSIQSTLARIFVESILDGVMAILVLGVMAVYSLPLTFIVLAGVFLYCVVRGMLYPLFRNAAREQLSLGAEENSYFLETIRTMTPIKLFGREAERIGRWQNLKEAVNQRSLKTQTLHMVFTGVGSVITGFQVLLVIFVGARAVINSEISVGMLMAFSSFATMFSSKVFAFIDAAIDYRLLSIHVDRLSDIVHSEPEPDVKTDTDLNRFSGSITLKGVRFRHSDGEPFILDGVDLHIPAGQCVALTGTSGAGKTTLCKIIVGLLQPTEGEVLVDNIPINKLGLSNYRALTGTVMQDDMLLAGTILENISFFDTAPSFDSVAMQAKSAAIHEEIMAMPMGYQTLIGDMGAGLSGGQKQRILLARALYKQPRILMLDEASSHLDIANELRVNGILADGRMTRVMVAHRAETIKMADRVFHLQNGRLSEVCSDNAVVAEPSGQALSA